MWILAAPFDPDIVKIFQDRTRRFGLPNGDMNESDRGRAYCVNSLNWAKIRSPTEANRKSPGRGAAVNTSLEKAQAIPEYVLILVLVAIVGLAIWSFLGDQITNFLYNVVNSLAG